MRVRHSWQSFSLPSMSNFNFMSYCERRAVQTVKLQQRTIGRGFFVTSQPCIYFCILTASSSEIQPRLLFSRTACLCRKGVNERSCESVVTSTHLAPIQRTICSRCLMSLAHCAGPSALVFAFSCKMRRFSTRHEEHVAVVCMFGPSGANRNVVAVWDERRVTWHGEWKVLLVCEIFPAL